jgi:hypothetical protein
MDEVTRETFLEAQPSEVWEALAEQAEDWFDGRRVVIERADEPAKLVFRWLDEPGRVVITVEPDGDGSIVRIIERRIEPAVSPTPSIGFKALARA